METRLTRAALAVSLALSPPLAAQPLQPVDIADLSIEDLANIQITSVSKKPERLAAAAASVFVITADDIRRSGAVNIPEALRLAPNLQVAQNNGTSYAISARGMNGSNNSSPNKLLVMIDGRSIYAPLFSGVFWEVQDVMLEDIERIEVISGPGGTLWGVNAVNGVINITTRNAAEIGGRLLSLQAGTRGSDSAFRQGGSNGGWGWRVYGKYQDVRRTELATGADVNDARHLAQAGFRADTARGPDRYSVHGAVYRGRAEQPLPGTISVTGSDLDLGPITSTGANLTAGWQHSLAGGGELALQGYLDYTRREVVPTYAESLTIADLQFQHALAAVGAHRLVWGANYRHSWDDVTNGPLVAFLPAKVGQTWASLFAQDEIALTDAVRLTVGARAERNDYTGTEFLPTLRLAWTPSSQHSFWTGWSRTVRAPSRLDADTFIPARPPYFLIGGPEVRSEVAKVVELGYRGQPWQDVSFSVTAFHNDYDHLRTQELISVEPLLVTFSNLMEGKARGIEMWGSYQAAPWWRLNAGFMALHQRFTLKPGSNDAPGPGSARKDPSHTAQLRSSFTLAADKDLDLVVRKVGALDNPAVPSYTAIDARLAWRPRRDIEVSLLGKNLNGSHAEYGALATRTEVARSVGVKLVWQN
ncbi:MAG TPA: TonB-dependent receptor [Telluria sp.]|jgi:iron complex outermembrane receptor protein